LKTFNKCRESGETPVSFEKAGPKENIFFEPAKTKSELLPAVVYARD
jgi:hypothetical protein